MKALLIAILALIATSPGLAQDTELAKDLKARRARMMAQLGPDTIFILQSAPVQTFSLDVSYEYRQNSDLYYLTGMGEPDTTLVLMPGNATRKEILFIRAGNPQRERYEGKTTTAAEAREASGIDTVLSAPQFEAFLGNMLSGRPFRLDPSWKTPDAASAEFKTFFDGLKANKARVALILEPRGLSGELTPDMQFANRLRERFFGFSLMEANDIIADLRSIKTPYEQTLIQQSADISSEAHLAAMMAAQPGRYEYEVESALEAVYTARGSAGWSYPSIVASGPNATTLHYEKSRRLMEGGDLLLVDAAANHQYMTVDITRTYPVNGTFRPQQREIYDLVLAAQEAGMQAVKPGAYFRDVEARITEVVKNGLLKLGLITDAGANSTQHSAWYLHGAMHFIGIDVHDSGDYSKPMAPGMAFVIEPGIYITDAGLDSLPNTPENNAFKEKVRPVAQKYRNIGVRIEDSFLLTESGLKRLSAKVPRTVEEIEAFLAKRPPRRPQ